MIDLSLVVPLYNEEESVTPLYKSICAALESLEIDAEIIFVDDGSQDATFAVVLQNPLPTRIPAIPPPRNRINARSTATINST